MTKVLRSTCWLVLVALVGCTDNGRSTTPQETPAQTKPDSSDLSSWTDVVDCLQFRARLQGHTFAPTGAVPVTISIRNSGTRNIAVLDPGKLPKAEANIVFQPHLVVGKKPFHFPSYPLAPTWKPEWYSILKPEQQISGKVEFEILDAPEEKHLLYLSVFMLPPRENRELKRWDKSDAERILPVVWRQGDARPKIGPVVIQIAGSAEPTAGADGEDAAAQP